MLLDILKEKKFRIIHPFISWKKIFDLWKLFIATNFFIELDFFTTQFSFDKFILTLK